MLLIGLRVAFTSIKYNLQSRLCATTQSFINCVTDAPADLVPRGIPEAQCENKK